MISFVVFSDEYSLYITKDFIKIIPYVNILVRGRNSKTQVYLFELSSFQFSIKETTSINEVRIQNEKSLNINIEDVS